MDKFTRAYIDAMLWSSNDDEGEPLDKNYTIDDLSKDCLAKCVEDCERFQKENAEDIATIPHRYTSNDNWSGDEQAGHDFWLTRNRHGVGYWDREYLTQAVKDRLTKNAQAYGEVYTYVSHDGEVGID